MPGPRSATKIHVRTNSAMAVEVALVTRFLRLTTPAAQCGDRRPSAHGNVTARACHGSVLRRTTYHTSRTFVSGVENSYDSKGDRKSTRLNSSHVKISY